MGRAVGIDLGTTNSAVAVLTGGEPEIIANAEGGRTTPSVVSFAKNGEVLVGEVAKRQAVTNVDRTIRSVKRHMGTDWSQSIDDKTYSAQEISARVLGKLKRDAEQYLGEPVVTPGPLTSSSPSSVGAVRSDRTVTCWGDDNADQSMAPAGAFQQVSAGYELSCGVRTDATLACWAEFGSAAIVPPAGTYTSVSAGRSQACALRTDGSATCWGEAGKVAEPVPTGVFVQVDAGASHACGVRPDASVLCWGDDSSGQAEAPSGAFSQVSAGVSEAMPSSSRA